MRRKARGFTLIEIMVVIAIIAGLIGTVAIIVPQMQEKQRRFTCGNNLSQLIGTFITKRSEKPGKPKYDGTALWLSYRVKDRVILEGQENILICPGDNEIARVDTPEAQKRYNDMDLKNPPDDACSYAGRDFSGFPLENEPKRVQILGCDRNGRSGRNPHHTDGVNVGFDDSSTRFMNREELGVSADSPIVVGPDATNEDLKKVIGIKVTKD